MPQRECRFHVTIFHIDQDLADLEHGHYDAGNIDIDVPDGEKISRRHVDFPKRVYSWTDESFGSGRSHLLDYVPVTGCPTCRWPSYDVNSNSSDAFLMYVTFGTTTF